MQVRALKRLIYGGKIYEAGALFEMAEKDAELAEKAANIEKVQSMKVKK